MLHQSGINNSYLLYLSSDGQVINKNQCGYDLVTRHNISRFVRVIRILKTLRAVISSYINYNRIANLSKFILHIDSNSNLSILNSCLRLLFSHPSLFI